MAEPAPSTPLAVENTWKYWVAPWKMFAVIAMLVPVVVVE
jgi:hypothetical protein